MIDPVNVYQWMYWDPDAQSHRSSAMYATVEVIRAGLGQPIYSSALKIERSALRDGGLYVPVREREVDEG